MNKHIVYHLSRVIADARRLPNAYEAHRTFWRAYGLDQESAGKAQPFRFRKEPASNARGVCYLVQSRQAPDWSKVDGIEVQTKQVSLDVCEGQEWQFALKSVVQISCRSPKDSRRIKRSIRDPHDIENWIHARAQAAGFEITRMSFDAPESERHLVHGEQHQFSVNNVRFDGEMVVRDVHSLESALLKGMGPKPAFGSGLLTIMPVF